jgi:hypothetical protein
METQTTSKKAIGALLGIALFSCQSMLAQQSQLAEDLAPTHSIIFIFSVLFFIAGFTLLIILKVRQDAKDKKEEEDTISHVTKHRHHHPNHYGHRHQYHH